jgi:hypothetical protein
MSSAGALQSQSYLLKSQVEDLTHFWARGFVILLRALVRSCVDLGSTYDIRQGSLTLPGPFELDGVWPPQQVSSQRPHGLVDARSMDSESEAICSPPRRPKCSLGSLLK